MLTRNKLFSLLFIGCTALAMNAQPVASNTKLAVDYVNLYKDIAVYEMLRTRIPASITLAQGILESQSGQSRLAREGNNHFGVKCKSTWTGPVIYEDDDDYQECFRSYENPFQSYIDHSNFLMGSTRYCYLFDLEVTDYKGWAFGLREAGYATNPQYATQLIEIIERYNLKQYDKYSKTIGHYQDTTEKHEVIATNGISSTKAQESDSYTKIAVENKMKVHELLEMNDLTEIKDLRYGDVVYLKPKRTSNQSYETHVMQIGESMYDISQLYGIKLSLLLERNGLEPGEEPSRGETITLNKKNKNPVKKRKVLKDGTHTVDMRIRMGERDETDSIAEAKFNVEAANKSKIDKDLGNVDVSSQSNEVYTGNKDTESVASNAAAELEDKLDEMVDNELYHYVRKSETLYSLSKHYKVTVDDLKQWNKLTDNTLKVGFKLRVTNHNGVESVSDKAYVKDEEGYYVVQQGDNLKEIALHFGLTEDELADMNKIANPDLIKVGDKLLVLRQAKQSTYRPPFHVVKPGDTLESIARKYDMKVDEIRKLNSLKTNVIKTGTKILLQ